MKGLLTRSPDGTLEADLQDIWGVRYRLTGTRIDGGYAVEIATVGIPEAIWLDGDEQWFDKVVV